MSNIKFSQLPNLGTITANTIVPVVAANTNYTITAANLQSYVNSSTGNVTGGNVLTGGVVSATGNVTGNYILGNGSQLTGLPATYGNANVVANLAALGSNPVSTTGNVTGGNLLTVGLISATGNVSVGGNLTVTGTAKIGASQVYTWPTSGGSTGYANLGTWTQSTFTGGGMLDIKLWLHGGYNSSIAQIATIETVLIINNGAAPWASNQTGIVATGNSAVTGVATAFTKLGAAWGGAYQPITSLVVVQNSTTSYTVWAQGVSTYTENGMYQVTFGPNADWTNSGTFQTGAPSYGSNYVTITPQTT